MTGADVTGTVRSREAAEALLAWFGGRERDVPWRYEPDPYRIWVCEVMAQQTRMGTVRERLPDFFAAFPNIESLAASDLDELMRAWEGLGYYARARNLRRAARRLVETAATGNPAERRDGGSGATLPTTAAALRELPGIGPYTAGAIASIAFGRPEPAVDGNARRVLSRLFDLAEPTRAALDVKARELIAAADDHLRGAKGSETPGGAGGAAGASCAGRLNQAIMDLGGEICTPRSPACGECPVSSHCLARARATIPDRPPRRPRPQLPHRDVAVALVRRDDGRLLIQRRPPEGLLGGLWEFPGGKVADGEPPAAAAVRETREETGLEVRVRGPAGVVEHAYSHFRITLHAFHSEVTGGALREGEDEPPRAWVRADGLSGYAFPAANRRILAGLGTPKN